MNDEAKLKNAQARPAAPRRFIWLLLAAVPCLALAVATGAQQSTAAQQTTETVVPVSQEPHHHLLFKNDYVQVYHVMAQYGNDVRMHRHEYDMISIQQGATETTVHSPGQPDRHQTIADGQIRYQLAGLVHNTQIMKPDLPFNNDTIALIHPQTNKRNLCVAVLAGEPLHCADEYAQARTTPGFVVLPEMETDQTRVLLLTVAPGADPSLKATGPAVIVALDDGKVIVGPAPANGKKDKKAAQMLTHRGEAVWLANVSPSLDIVSKSDHETRLVALLLKP